MNKTGKVIQQIIIHLVFLGLAIWFIIMGWWPALIIEAVVIIALLISIAFIMVHLILVRNIPMITGDIIGDIEGVSVNEHVRDSVEWLEGGEFWEQRSEDGLKLIGRFRKKEGSHTYAICCHGYKNHRMQDIANQAKRFFDMGHNVFAGHARGHGRSEGAYVGMAFKERRDIVGWIRKIVEQDPEARIFLYGVSMGGATVMATSGEELPENVKCVIEDCGYSSIWKEFCYHMWFAYGLPVHPILNICELISKKRYGYGFHDHTAIDQVKKTKLPMLFIHGDEDTFVPYEMMEPLYQACGSEHKRMVTIPGARHAEAYFKGEDLYWKEIGDWLKQYL